MFPQKFGLISVILVVVSVVPKRTMSRPTVPTWHLPCGRNIVTETVSSDEIDLRSGLDNVMLQHQLTLNDYLKQDYEYFYEKVRISVRDHQYIPNWVPGKKENVNLVKRLANADPQAIVNHLPKLHMDLQKFAVAFEELVEDEISSQIQKALRETQSQLMTMLCEVESNIMTFSNLQVPTRVERNIMNSIERDPVDETRRLIRDWGILLKYRDYLHAWRHVFNY